MSIILKFVNDIIRPWEKLNAELVERSSIDQNVSDFIATAEILCIRISHFPELLKRKSIRTDKSSKAFSTIVDIADTVKHVDQKIGRTNSLTLSSMFEGNDEGNFRFLRNRILIEHEKYGKSDFLDCSKESIQFLIQKTQYPLIWNPSILEFQENFYDEVALNIYFNRQIAWTGLRIEFVKRTSDGALIHFDPPKWLFKLTIPPEIEFNSWKDYVGKLLHRSIAHQTSMLNSVSLPISTSNSGDSFLADFIITTSEGSKKYKTIVKLFENDNIEFEKIQELENIVLATNSDNIIVITPRPLSDEIQQKVSLSFKNINLISIDKFDATSIPLEFFKINYTHNPVKIISINKSKIFVPKQDGNILNEFNGLSIQDVGKVFTIDKLNFVSFLELCYLLLKPKSDETNRTKTLKYTLKREPYIYMKVRESIIQIGIEVDLEWEMETKNLRMPILQYESNNLGICIWNLQSYFILNSNISKVSIPVTKFGNTSAIAMLSSNGKKSSGEEKK